MAYAPNKPRMESLETNSRLGQVDSFYKEQVEISDDSAIVEKGIDSA